MLRRAQECESNFGWHTVPVLASDKSVTYAVLIAPWDRDDPQSAMCDCISFKFRGWCRHQVAAYQQICRWSSLEGPAPLELGICPACGGPTRTVIYDDTDVADDERTTDGAGD